MISVWSIRWITVALLVCLLSSVQLRAQQPSDLSTATLEDLTQMQLKVSSFARKDQNLWLTPAAVFVITKEEIERSAATSIPELLRIVPGVQVAQITASTWAVSARGFNSAYANKLLVLIDGRTVYSEVYAGAHWDQTDLPLDQIERIEVIRGPGAAIWGTNAVNGVINIITKRARNTIGFTATGTSSRMDEMTSIRYGASIGNRMQYRGYMFYRNREALDAANGSKAFDGESVLRAGGRLDWQRNERDWLTITGDLYDGHLRQQLRPRFAIPVGPDGHDFGSVGGGFLLGRLERKTGKSDMALQAYYDDTSRGELRSYSKTHTFAAELQQHIKTTGRNDVVWGGGFRYTRDRIGGAVLLTKKPLYNNILVDGFVQDEIVAVPHRLVFTFGSKIQQGTLAGFQLQPSARALLILGKKQTAWAAVSRAVVAPAIQDKEINVPLLLGEANGLPILGTLVGNPAIKPEIVIAYELGARRRLTSSLTMDVASFYNDNRRLLAGRIPDPTFVPQPTPHLYTTLTYENGYRADTVGIEASLTWKPRSSFSWQGSYAWMQAKITQTSPGPVVLFDLWETPRNSFSSSAFWAFAPHWTVNTFVSYLDALHEDKSQNAGGGTVPSLSRVDFTLSRRLPHNIDIGAGGTNLLSSRHVEFGNGTAAVVPGYVPRSLFIRVKHTF